MRPKSLLSLCTLLQLSLSHPPPPPNANHIFNALHSSLRQWGSSLNHNGMSFFLATVPAGTHLFHGTSHSEPVKGMEWLAFEPEHALIFARARGGGEETEEGKSVAVDGEYHYARQERLYRPHYDPSQHPLPTEHIYQPHGYLHTYTPPSPLHLLYIDGLSAGKTSNGTLDTQDFLLLLNHTHAPTNRTGGMIGELLRAEGLCNLTRTLWEGKLHGILRMEGGFEVILCDFEAHVERASLIAVSPAALPGVPQTPGVMGGWPYIKAVASRYHGLGGGRVKLDYENFVTVFAERGGGGGGLDLWDGDVESDVKMPRLTGLKVEELEKVRQRVTDMVLRGPAEGGRDWQAIVDLVVRRYSQVLRVLRDEGVREEKGRFARYLWEILRPFVEWGARNREKETQRCVGQFVPELEPEGTDGEEEIYPLAYRALHGVTMRICSALLSAYETTASTMAASSAATPPGRALEIIDELVAYLQWTTWKECGTCGYDEVCWIPIWPMGELEDHKSPQCRNESTTIGRTGYWGRRNFGTRPPPEAVREGGHNLGGMGRVARDWAM